MSANRHIYCVNSPAGCLHCQEFNNFFSGHNPDQDTPQQWHWQQWLEVHNLLLPFTPMQAITTPIKKGVTLLFTSIQRKTVPIPYQFCMILYPPTIIALSISGNWLWHLSGIVWLSHITIVTNTSSTTARLPCFLLNLNSYQVCRSLWLTGIELFLVMGGFYVNML